MTISGVILWLSMPKEKAVYSTNKSRETFDSEGVVAANYESKVRETQMKAVRFIFIGKYLAQS